MRREHVREQGLDVAAGTALVLPIRPTDVVDEPVAHLARVHGGDGDVGAEHDAFDAVAEEVDEREKWQQPLHGRFEEDKDDV